MRAEDLVLVSVDDHVVEPPDVFEGRLPASLAGNAPHLVRKDAGNEVWVYEDVEIPTIGVNAVAGRPPEEYSFEPASFDDMREGCYDIHRRVEDMNRNGVLGSLCFPSFPQFCGQLFMRSKDKAAALEMVRAYNDWHIEDWAGAYPGRFIPLGIPPIWDPEAMAEEVRRTAGKGCHAVSFSEMPERLGLPSLHSDHWDPFWAACADTGTVVCLHFGSSSSTPKLARDAPPDVLITLMTTNSIQAAADLVWSPVLRKFPRLRFALSEGGIGWVPYLLDRLDYVYQHHRAWTKQDFGDRLPSQVFREHVFACFIDDPAGIEMRHLVGIDNVMWECDYPHSDSTWPQSPEELSKSLSGLPEEDVEKITHGNAMRVFGFDPFAHRPRENCTASALRAEAPTAL